MSICEINWLLCGCMEKGGVHRSHTREEGSANNTVKKKVSLFTIRENGENCLGLFQTIWNISAATADYMLFSTLYFLHTHTI